MSTQELLTPRYEVIADYPNSPWEVGDILTHKLGFTYRLNHSEIVRNLPDIDKYPHLFAPMPWWQGRSVEEMPRYVENKSGYILPVVEWRISKFGVDFLTEKHKLDKHNTWHNPTWYKPSDYTAYINEPKNETDGSK